MDYIYLTLWFGIAGAMLWDMHRTQRIMQASLERIEQTAKDVSDKTDEILRRTPRQA